MNILIRESICEDIEALSPFLREPDKLEVLTMGVDPKEALTVSFKQSSACFSLLLEGEIIAMFGIAPKSLLGNTAILWCLTSSGVEKVRVFFGKQSKKYVSCFLNQYAVLENWVDSRYERSIHWLKWLGAEFDMVTNINGVDFCHFEIRRG